MATMSKKFWEKMPEKQRQKMLHIISTDNAIRGLPTFSDYLQTRTELKKSTGLRTWLANKIIAFGWWFSGKSST